MTNMNGLSKIAPDELLFSGEIDDGGINTHLILDDYDWMSYKLRTCFKTKKQYVLAVEFEYIGMRNSMMTVEQREFAGTFAKYNPDDFTRMRYIYTYDSNIFKEEIIRFMESHIKSWYSSYAFYGEQEVLHFFNRVIEETPQDKIKIEKIED